MARPPGRTAAWYAEQERDIRARTGGLDDLHQEYPATDLEALAPRAVDKFFPTEWVNRCFEKLDTGSWKLDTGTDQLATVPGLAVHVPPQPGQTYVIGADPAEGNPQSDESAAVVLDFASGEQVATLACAAIRRCRRTPGPPGQALRRLPSRRGDHGRAQQPRPRRDPGAPLHRCVAARGLDGEIGWATTGASKHLLFDQAAKDIRRAGCGCTTRRRSGSFCRSTAPRWRRRRVNTTTAPWPACWRWRPCARRAGRAGQVVHHPAVDVIKEIDEGRF